MQKKLLGMAVAAALAAPGLALAQAAGTGLQIYGVIEAMPMHNKFDGGPAGTNKSDMVVHNIASRIGFRGREALGGNLSAWFQAEMGIATGRPHVDHVANGVNWLGGRNTGVGLDSSFGTIMAGTWDSPYKLAGLQSWNLGTFGLMSHYGMIMNNGDSTGTEPSAVNGSNQVGVYVESSATAFGRRLSNSVQYWSPRFAGAQIRLATQMNGQKANDGFATQHDPELWAASVVWGSGPLTIGGAFERHEGFQATTTTTNNSAKDDAWQIGAKYTFGAFAIGAGYETIEYGDTGGGTDFELKNWVLNGTFNIGAGQIFAGYSQTDGRENCGALVTGCGSATEADIFSLGYAHNLSKRTKAYVSFSQIDNGFDSTTGVGSGYYYVAGPVGNAGNGASAGIVGGTDVRSIGVGIQHSF